MKLSLVVAQGVHAGKSIPIGSPEFLIGRDPQCQLRPASPAVSKQHTAISVKNGKVYVRDCGSTNGTFLNDEQIAGDREANSGDLLRVGPLEFRIMIEAVVPAEAKPAPVKPAVSIAAAKKAATIATDTVPSGGTVIFEPGSTNPEHARAASTTIVDAPGSGLDADPDHAAALLLGLDDGAPSESTVEQMSADSTTVMEVPALGAKPGEAKKEEAKKPIGDSSSAAAEALSRYMRRPRT